MDCLGLLKDMGVVVSQFVEQQSTSSTRVCWLSLPSNKPVATTTMWHHLMPKKLTINQWLKQLPEPIRSAALANRKKANKKIWKDKGYQTLGLALANAFSWNSSPEHHAFWNEVNCAIYKINPFPPLPTATTPSDSTGALAPK